MNRLDIAPLFRDAKICSAIGECDGGQDADPVDLDALNQRREEAKGGESRPQVSSAVSPGACEADDGRNAARDQQSDDVTCAHAYLLKPKIPSKAGVTAMNKPKCDEVRS